MADHRAHILILSHNSRALLAECLPSIVHEAASHSNNAKAKVSVIDNESSDGTIEWLEAEWPDVGRIREPNRGLASFNAVLKRIDEPIALLLNSDVKLGPNAIQPLLDSLDADPNALFAAPLCWGFDESTYEGLRTRVRMRYGLIQGVCRTPGHEAFIHQPGLTASAGPILAVRRDRFLELGGYDPLYFPGRLEDLDLGFRAWLAGWTGVYQPRSVAYHLGAGSFGPAFGASGCDRLAVRNTFLFCWKNLRGRRLAGHLAWLPVRLAFAILARRWGFLQGFGEASRRLPQALRSRCAEVRASRRNARRQNSFFEAFDWSDEIPKRKVDGLQWSILRSLTTDKRNKPLTTNK